MSKKELNDIQATANRIYKRIKRLKSIVELAQTARDKNFATTLLEQCFEQLEELEQIQELCEA